MRNLFLLPIAATLVFFISCQKKDDVPVAVVPVAPTNLIAGAFSTSQINLSWSANSKNESGFKVERKTDSSDFEVIGDVGKNITTFLDTGLAVTTTYIYKVYAYNSTGNSPYSNEASATIGVTICNQVWMTKNLNVSTYRNGDSIPQVRDPETWVSLRTGAWCWYKNDSTTYGSTYGKLYNWYAITDSRGLAPIGWHIPNYTEFDALCTCLGGVYVAGGAMKEKGTAHWLSPNTGATNLSGFTGLPGGVRNDYGGRGNVGVFTSIGNFGHWWLTTESTDYQAWMGVLSNGDEGIATYGLPKPFGLSVRSVKD